jgi:hypothetical protein
VVAAAGLHGLVMFFYTSPIIWFPLIAILTIGFAFAGAAGAS